MNPISVLTFLYILKEKEPNSRNSFPLHFLTFPQSFPLFQRSMWKNGPFFHKRTRFFSLYAFFHRVFRRTATNPPNQPITNFPAFGFFARNIIRCAHLVHLYTQNRFVPEPNTASESRSDFLCSLDETKPSFCLYYLLLAYFLFRIFLISGHCSCTSPQFKIPGTMCMRMYEPMILLSATYGRLPSVSFGYPGSRILTKQNSI